MKEWPWRTILCSISCALVVVGIAPITYITWWGIAHNLEPLSAPLSLKRGEYASPFFKTDLDDDYQVEIYFLPDNRTPLNLDWKILDSAGTEIGNGTYKDQGGNDAILERHYHPRRGSQQRIILNIQQDVQTTGSDVKLHVGLPERGLEQAYGSAAAIVWAVIVGSPGATMLLVLLILRVRPSRLDRFKSQVDDSGPQSTSPIPSTASWRCVRPAREPQFRSRSTGATARLCTATLRISAVSHSQASCAEAGSITTESRVH